LAIANLGKINLHYLQLKPQEEDDTNLENLVLVHGLAANLGFWYFSIAPKLAENYCVTMFDLRGHGRSSMPPSGYNPEELADDLAQLLDYLEIKQAHLLGHSLGGSVMAHFACRYPHRISSLVFADVRLKIFQPAMTFADWTQWNEYRPLLEELGIDLSRNSGELGYQLLAEMARLHIQSPERSDQLLSVLPNSLFSGFAFAGKGGDRSAKSLLTLLSTTTAISELSQEDRITVEQLQAITCPVLSVYGSQSQTLQTLSGLRSIWPHLNVEIVPNAGHFFPNSQPEALIRPVQTFLAQQSTHP
jgi:pimeloyl-ACP methyl ester carboxylesterase